jgi:hypothetical protein
MEPASRSDDEPSRESSLERPKSMSRDSESASPIQPRPKGGSGARALAFDLGALLLLFAVVCGPFLRHVYRSVIPGGWDGVPHYAIADIYAHKLFPAIGGWVDEYFGGMPYPNFYPPVFYLIVAALTKLGLSTKTAFLAVQTTASAAVPLLTYLCARRLASRGGESTSSASEAGGGLDTGRVAGLVAGAITVGFMVDHSPLYRVGITLHSTFDAGLSTQLLSHCVLLVFYWALLAADERRSAAVLAAISFALVPLTNIHMVWPAAFLFLPLAIVRIVSARSPAERRRALIIHATIGLTGVLIAACWTIPMVANLRYVPTQALERPPTGLIAFAFLRIGIYVVFGGLAAAARRDPRALSLVGSLLLLLTFSLLPSSRIPVLRDLALQPMRLLVAFPFLAAFLVGYLVSSARDVIRRPWAQLAVGVACAALFFARFKLGDMPKGNISQEQMDRYENALGPMAGRTDGRVLVEVGPDGLADPFSLQALAGMRGARSLTTVFREAALDVMFAVPLRNSFSAKPEAFGIDHKITGTELAASGLPATLARLELFNIRYFAVRSESVKAQIQRLPDLHRISPEGPWELWGFDADAPGYATVPEFAPVLTFARFSVKPRPDDSVDFVRLGEEMFEAGRLQIPLALARDGRLDRNDDWDRFQVALITEYRYDQIDRAYEAIERASRDRTIVLWPSSDPLYARLVELGKTRPTMRFVEAEPPTPLMLAKPRLAGRLACKRIMAALDAVKEPLRAAPRVSTARLDGREVEIVLDRDPEKPVPIWVRQGYFPSWKNDSGEPVYLATPTFQLTFAKARATALHFRFTLVDWIARLLSLVGLAIAFALFRWFPAIASRDEAPAAAVERLAR